MITFTITLVVHHENCKVDSAMNSLIRKLKWAQRVFVQLSSCKPLDCVCIEYNSHTKSLSYSGAQMKEWQSKMICDIYNPSHFTMMPLSGHSYSLLNIFLG